VYHRDKVISEPFKFMIPSFERQKQQDLEKDLLKKGKRPVRQSNPPPEPEPEPEMYELIL
jgi:hypothetical protein